MTDQKLGIKIVDVVGECTGECRWARVVFSDVCDECGLVRRKSGFFF